MAGRLCVSIVLSLRLWGEIVILPAWLPRNPKSPGGWFLFSGWPSQQWLEDVATIRNKPRQKHHSVEVAEPADSPLQPLALDYETVAQLQQLLSSNATTILSTSSNEDQEDKAGAEAQLSHLLVTLRHWKFRLMPGAARNFRQFYTAEQLVYAIDLSLQAKSGTSELKQICVSALKALFPSISDVVWATMARDRLPSSTSVTRHMVSLEVAMILLERENAKKSSAPRIRYGLVDASPAWGLDWLWVQETSVPGGSQLVSLYHVSVTWMRDMLLWQTGLGTNTSSVEPDSIPGHLQLQLRHIAAHIETHTYTPIVIGSGYANLSHKIGACLHSFMLHCGTLSALQEHADSFLSWTTDLGTESGFSEYRCLDVSSLLPSWWRAPKMECDLEECENKSISAPRWFGSAATTTKNANEQKLHRIFQESLQRCLALACPPSPLKF